MTHKDHKEVIRRKVEQVKMMYREVHDLETEEITVVDFKKADSLVDELVEYLLGIVQEVKGGTRKDVRRYKVYDVTCIVCSKVFTAYRSDSKVCGGKCKIEWSLARDKKKARIWYAKNREKQIEATNKFSRTKKGRANQLLNRAVKTGLVKKLPCEECGEKRVDGHHYDYDKPLDVIWLCPQHHRAMHSGKLIHLLAKRVPSSKK